MKKLTDCKVGDKVYIEGGMGNSASGDEIIQEVAFKFDQDTGRNIKYSELIKITGSIQEQAWCSVVLKCIQSTYYKIKNMIYKDLK